MQAAIGAVPVDLAKIESLLREGRADEAYQLAVAKEAELAGEPDYDYMLGLAALQSGRPAEAEHARGIGWKVRILDPDTRERTGLGAVSDTFRWRTDVTCSTGLFRMCAWGQEAASHSQGYKHLLDVDGWVLLIGVDIYRCSSMHLGSTGT